MTRPNGVTTTDGYDAAGRLTSITHTKGAATLASFSYVLDENGNRRAVTSAAGTEGYTLNELNQLTKVTLPGGSTIDYTYDPAGNRATRTAGGSTTIVHLRRRVAADRRRAARRTPTTRPATD